MVYLTRLSVYQTVISLMCVSQYISTEGHNCFILAMNIIELSKQYHLMNKNIYDVSVLTLVKMFANTFFNITVIVYASRQTDC